MTVKQQAQQLVAKLPEDVDWDQLMYRFYVLQKIERARQDVEAGRVLSQEDVERRMEQWLKP